MECNCNQGREPCTCQPRTFDEVGAAAIAWFTPTRTTVASVALVVACVVISAVLPMGFAR